MRIVCIVILLIFSGSIGLSQVHIKTQNGESVYGIVCEETTENITILKPDGFRHIIPIKQMYYLKELDALIKTKDSTSFTAHIFFIDNDSVYYHFGGGKAPRSIPRSNVLDIEYDSGEQQKSKKTNEIKSDSETDTTSNRRSEIQGDYWMYGITLLCPGGVNLLVGEHFDNDFGFRFQLGGLTDGEVYGIGAQFNFLYNFNRTINFEHNVSIGVGETFLNSLPGTDEMFYVGFFYDLNVSGFFIETGLAFNRGKVSDSYIFLQFGYVVR